ncbi:MAG: hypothetical protein ACJZ1R_09280 [Candidatus Neomarinimicrobiota bacterium]
MIEQIHSGYLTTMFLRLFLFVFICSCVFTPPPNPILIPPLKKSLGGEKQKTVYTLGYMSEYDIWEFLKESPSEKEVLDTFGFPDSVWVDDLETTKFLYYFISDIQDFNTIEISAKTDSVSGFEWD